MKGCVIVRVLETVPCYGGRTYELEVMGFGEPTEEQAKSEAARMVASYTARTGRAYRAEFAVRCGACLEKWGVQAGCKKKACSVCGGVGTVPLGAAASLVSVEDDGVDWVHDPETGSTHAVHPGGSRA